jgi:hypothetical protein
MLSNKNYYFRFDLNMTIIICDNNIISICLVDYNCVHEAIPCFNLIY